jgi:putative transposase
MRPKRYPSDLTTTQWRRVQDVLPPAKPGGRPRSVELREVLNGILYVVRANCSWRMMPKDLPPWSTCYDYYRKWSKDGTWKRLSNALPTPGSGLSSRRRGKGPLETIQESVDPRST